MRILPALGTALALILTGCSSSSSTAPTAAAPTPNNVALTSAVPAGARSFYATGDAAGDYVETYLGTDGNGFMLVAADDAQPAGAFITFQGSSFMRVPAPSAPVTLPGSDASAVAIAVTPLTLAAAAGTFNTVISGTDVTLTISPTGAISGSGSSWGVSGTLQATSTIAGALPFSMTVSGLTGATGTFKGYALNTPDDSPAQLRLVGQNGTTVLDWVLM